MLKLISMNKKTIQILIIVIAFAASGFVLYRGFSGNKSSAPAVVPGVPGSANGADIDKILSNRATLDFNSVLKRPNVQYDTLSLPDVKPEEIGHENVPDIIPIPLKPAN
jgi:hypothetical protein